MDTKVVGVVGRNGSGKDEVLNYLRDRCGIAVVSAGNVVRDIAKKKNIEPTRENLHRISLETMAREGNDFFAHKLIQTIDGEGWSAVGVTGVRTLYDVEAFRHRFGDHFRLVHVNVESLRLRFDRLRMRDEARDPETWAAFLDQEQKEEEQFEISKTISRADVTIENNGSLDELHQNIETSPIWKWICEEGGEAP